MEVVVVLVIVAAVLGLIGLMSSLRVIKQYERGVIYRFGRVTQLAKEPGPRMLVPFVDRMTKVNMQVITMPVPAQDGITRDNVSVRVDAVLYFRVIDPVRATVDVQNYQFAMLQVAQTSLRSIIGKSDLDDLLSGRERLHEGLELMLSTPATGWGVHIDRVEIKDVTLPESMKRSMARQAEADRERRARIITADGELQASQKLSEAAQDDGREPLGAATAAAPDRGGGGRREELDPRDALPRGDAALLRPGRAAPAAPAAGAPNRQAAAPAVEPAAGPAGIDPPAPAEHAELPKGAQPQIPDPRSSEE